MAKRETIRFDEATGECISDEGRLTLPLTPPLEQSTAELAAELKRKEEEELKLTHPGNYL